MGPILVKVNTFGDVLVWESLTKFFDKVHNIPKLLKDIRQKSRTIQYVQQVLNTWTLL